MAETPPDTSMGPETPATTARSSRRTRRVAIIGALALVLVAGAVLVGAQVTGSRAGATTTDVIGTVSCAPATGSTTFAPADVGDFNVRFFWLDQYGATITWASAIKSNGVWSASTTAGAVGLKVAWVTPGTYLDVSKTFGTLCSRP